MGGLGNGRRGGRSPPLMIGALIACILVLGFNYWVSSSRNLDLQTKLYDLESQVRRGVAERRGVETKKNEYQEEIQKQKAQITNMETLLKRELEEAQYSCSQQKSTLQQNISSSTKTIQKLKGQLNQLNDELNNCHGNIDNLNQKLTNNINNCNSQLQSQKELCDERVAAVKLEVQKHIPSQHVPPQQEKADDKELVEKEHAVAGAVATVVSHAPSLSLLKGKEPEILTNEIIVGKVLGEPGDLSPPKDLSKVDSQSVTSADAVKQGILPPPEGAVKAHHNEAENRKPLKDNLTEGKAVEVIDANEQGAQTEDPEMESMLIGQRREDESPIGQKLEDTLEYEADEQVGGVDLEKEQQNKRAENIDRDEEEEQVDYNGDNENEGEFEADKQDELAQN
ncbi:Golgi membrane protein 1 isoform X2 [Betta splendens]|uniref:Golgi membrane protein 1 isoform X2 n=1 Tax=Betta splendens TaxID=158456 RepID=A0A6P7NBS8_BETSP|nr:Golgi membrane protein 1 isoform X2 [Betta splendens]